MNKMWRRKQKARARQRKLWQRMPAARGKRVPHGLVLIRTVSRIRAVEQ